MAAKRFLIFALALVLGATGCQAWCARHYPCPAPACVPCCPPASGYQPAASWTAPVAAPRPQSCTCTLQ